VWRSDLRLLFVVDLGGRSFADSFVKDVLLNHYQGFFIVREKCIYWVMLFVLGITSSIAVAANDSLPVKIFVLAGQSNMEGQAVVDLSGKDYNEGRGTLLSLWDNAEKRAMVQHLRNEDGTWSQRDDVFVHYQREKAPLLKGHLGVGYAVYGGTHHFGPELQFGHVVGNYLDNPIVLIKTAWGGKSLYQDFRPPSSMGEVGPYYTKMIQQVKQVQENLASEFPELAGRKIELAGFVWYHGWNDGVSRDRGVPEYEENLANLIRDVRRDLNAPGLPFVVGELTGPWIDAPDEWEILRKAQADVPKRDEFRDNSLFVTTRTFVRKPEDSPNPGHGHHEFGNAETYFLVGNALGQGMVSLLENKEVK